MIIGTMRANRYLSTSIQSDFIGITNFGSNIIN